MHAAPFTLMFAASALAHTVFNVSVTDDYTFEPNSLSDVQEGDEVWVWFDDHAHDIVSSTFDSPCVYNADGENSVNSGILQDNEVFAFTVNSTDTQWFFCSYGTHCQQGMALVINQSGDDTIEDYQTAAADATTDNEGVTEPVGGMVMTLEEAEDSDDGHSHDGDDADMATDDSAAANLQSSLALVAAAVAGMVAFMA